MNIDENSSFVVSCRAPRELTDIIENVIEKHPRAFRNKSDFVLKALLHFLRHLGAIEGDKARRLRIDAITGNKQYDGAIEETFCVDKDKR